MSRIFHPRTGSTQPRMEAAVSPPERWCSLLRKRENPWPNRPSSACSAANSVTFCPTFSQADQLYSRRMPLLTPASPGFIRPEIPTLVPEPPSGEGSIHDIKHGGYLTPIVIEGGKVRAFPSKQERQRRVWPIPCRSSRMRDLGTGD